MNIDNAVLVQFASILMYSVAFGVVLGHVIIGAFRALMDLLHLVIDRLELRRVSAASCDCQECGR